MGTRCQCLDAAPNVCGSQLQLLVLLKLSQLLMPGQVQVQVQAPVLEVVGVEQVPQMMAVVCGDDKTRKTFVASAHCF